MTVEDYHTDMIFTCIGGSADHDKLLVISRREKEKKRATFSVPELTWRCGQGVAADAAAL